MLKIDLHTHTCDDPHDAVPHTLQDLIDRAAGLGFHAVAVTLHDRQLDLTPWSRYARDRGLLLLPGVERSIDGRHVLLINFPPEAADVRSLEDIAALKRRATGVVIAPHPFYPLANALGNRMEAFAPVIDAVEYNATYTRWANPNIRAVRWAAAYEKAVVGNSDLHRLHQMGTTWSEVDADAEPEAICEAIRARRVRAVTRPLSMLDAVRTTGEILAGGMHRRRWWPLARAWGRT